MERVWRGNADCFFSAAGEQLVSFTDGDRLPQELTVGVYKSTLTLSVSTSSAYPSLTAVPENQEPEALSIETLTKSSCMAQAFMRGGKSKT
jgi:hypothetical protein